MVANRFFIKVTDIQRKRANSSRILVVVLLILYLSFLFWRMFFYAYDDIHRTQFSVMKFNLIPLKSIIDLIRSPKKYGFIAWGYNLFGNISIFVPLGFLIPFIFGNKLRKTIIISFYTILFAEFTQLISRLGVFDVDDIILNIIGCLIGYAMYVVVMKWIRLARSDNCR